MKTILQEIRAFFNKEQVYAYLLFAILVTTAFLRIISSFEPAQISPALEKIHAAETVFADKDAQVAQYTQMVTENPMLGIFFSVAFLLLTAFFLFGVGICVYIVVSYLRKKDLFSSMRKIEGISWSISEVMKVIIIFMSVSLGLGFAMGGVNSWLFDGAHRNMMLIFHTLIADCVVLGAIYYFVKVKENNPLKVLGLKSASPIKDVFLGISAYSLLLPIFMTVLIVLNFVVTFFDLHPDPHPLIDVFVDESGNKTFLTAISLVLACTVGPVIEEVFFRGFCYSAFKKHIGTKGAMILSAAFFAFIHNSLFAFVPIFILGLGLAWLYERRGSLIPSITVHIVHNSLFIGYFLIVKKIYIDTVV